MFPEPVKVIFVQYVVQGLLALVIMLILRKFFRQYKNDFFDYWSWSWLALFINMISSLIALGNSYTLPLSNPLRLLVSFISVTSGLLQMLWLYAGNQRDFKSKAD